MAALGYLSGFLKKKDSPKRASNLRLAPIWLRRALIGAFALIVVLMALAILNERRSFLIEAETGGLAITFGQGENTWSILNALHCRKVPPIREVADLGPCGFGAELVSDQNRTSNSLSEFVLDWVEDSRVEIRLTRENHLRIEFATNPPDGFDEGSFLLVSEAAWRQTGALTFRGNATIGVEVDDGAVAVLQSGRWEAREAGLVTSALRNVTEVVKSGDFARGARVTVRKDGEPASSTGHITPSGTDLESVNGGPLIYVVMVSEVGNTSLVERHFGVANEVIIEPDWVDIAISSPLVVFFTILFALLASVTQILGDVFWSSRNPVKSGVDEPDEQKRE